MLYLTIMVQMYPKQALVTSYKFNAWHFRSYVMRSITVCAMTQELRCDVPFQQRDSDVTAADGNGLKLGRWVGEIIAFHFFLQASYFLTTNVLLPTRIKERAIHTHQYMNRKKTYFKSENSVATYPIFSLIPFPSFST